VVKIKREEIIDAFIESLGEEKTERLIKEKVRAAGLEDKESYTREEVEKLVTELSKEGGLIKVIAHCFMARVAFR